MINLIDLIISWLLSAGALLLASRLFARVNLKGDLADALWVSALFAVLAFFLQWFFFVLLGLATLGLGFVFHFITRLLAAAIVLKITSALSSRFDIKGFMPAVGTAVLLVIAAEIAVRISAAI